MKVSHFDDNLNIMETNWMEKSVEFGKEHSPGQQLGHRAANQFGRMNCPNMVGQKDGKAKEGQNQGPFNENFNWREEQGKLGESGSNTEEAEGLQEAGILHQINYLIKFCGDLQRNLDRQECKREENHENGLFMDVPAEEEEGKG
jgi:hypothetical protein